MRQLRGERAGGVIKELLVAALHGDVPHVAADVLGPAVGGLVDLVLYVSHQAQHSRYDPQRQHGFHPSQPHLPSSSSSSPSSLSLSLYNPPPACELRLPPRAKLSVGPGLPEFMGRPIKR